jgi:hypothetical protein
VGVRKDVIGLTSELPICRAAGITELIPDFSIEFPYRALLSDSDTGNKRLALYTNTSITNQTLENSANEVHLSVEEGRAPVDTASGVQLGPSAVGFANVLPIYPPPKGSSVRIRFSGLRVNACQIGVGELTPTTIQAALGVFDKDHPANFELLTDPIDIARIAPSMCFEASALRVPTATLPISLGRDELPQEVMLRVSYRPLTAPSPFRPREEERSPTELANINGTSLELRITGVPRDVKVFVSTGNLPESNDEVAFQLTEANLNSQSREIDGHPAETSELIVVGSTATAVWKCIRHVEPWKTPAFGVHMSIPSNADVYSIAVYGSFSPISTVQTASSTSPVPRFCSDQLPIKVFAERPF